MEEKVMKFTAAMLLGLAVIFAVLYLKLPDVRVWAGTGAVWSEQEHQEEQDKMGASPVKDAETTDEENRVQLRLSIPSGISGEQINISNHYVTQTLRIEIPHTEDSYFQNSITGSSDHVIDLSYRQGKNVDVIEITMDRVFEFDTKYDEEYYYIEFIEPKELYDYVLVIDAGHGGQDGGAENSGILEKDIDLAIVLALKEMFDAAEENIKVYYTRTDDSNPSYVDRVGLANKSEADLFISVHNNSYKDSSAVRGSAVMYSESFEGKFTSRRLAEICMEELIAALNSEDRGILEGDSIYIIKNSQVPVALIEVGFMTNWKELALLNSKEYQKKAAEAIYQAVFRALEETSETE